MENYATQVRNLQDQILKAKLGGNHPKQIQKLQQELDSIVKEKPQLTLRENLYKL